MPMMRNLPRAITFVVALVPVAAFVFVVGSVVQESLPAFQMLGAALFGGTFSPPRLSAASAQYGLLAPIWGTVLVTMITLFIAIPGSLSLALVMEELPLGRLSRALSPVLGIMSGIPPIVYAILSLILVEVLMRPKFAGGDLQDEAVKAAIQGQPIFLALRVPSGLPNSQVLGGLLLALLVVPLMTPLVADALHGVPADLRLASYALGAGRWHTIVRIVVPVALPGIVSAVTLGALKAIGEVTIPYFAVAYGLEVVRVPDPLLDVLWHTQPLSSTGAVLLRGFNTEGSGAGPGVVGLPAAVASTTGVMLLAIAFGIMALAAFLQSRLSTGTHA
jgi:phosphate transport system permease protein